MTFSFAQSDCVSRLHDVRSYLKPLGMTLHQDGIQYIVKFLGVPVPLKEKTLVLLTDWVFKGRGPRWKITQAILDDFQIAGCRR